MALHQDRLLVKFRPRFTGMTGICAGNKEQVKMGDLIIADQAYFYDVGKHMRDEKGGPIFLSDVDHYKPTSLITHLIQTFDDKQFLQKMDGWLAFTHYKPTCYPGTMASGSAVRADHLFEVTIFPVRK